MKTEGETKLNLAQKVWNAIGVPRDWNVIDEDPVISISLLVPKAGIDTGIWLLTAMSLYNTLPSGFVAPGVPLALGVKLGLDYAFHRRIKYMKNQ